MASFFVPISKKIALLRPNRKAADSRMMENSKTEKNESLMFSGRGSGAPPTEQGHLSVAVRQGIYGRNVAVACRLLERGLAAKSPFRRIGGGRMIRHRLLCLGYFDFGSAGLFSPGFLSLFAAYAQQGQNAAADEQSRQPTDEATAVTGPHKAVFQRSSIQSRGCQKCSAPAHGSFDPCINNRLPCMGRRYYCAIYKKADRRLAHRS